MSTTTGPQADQFANGVTSAHNVWSVARYGTTVVTTFDGQSDDMEMATEQDAIEEYADMVAALNDNDTRCAVYALCENPATRMYDFGAVGNVPSCERCAERTDRLKR